MRPSPNEQAQLITLGGAGAGTVLALLGMYDWLVPYMEVLGTLVPPIGGIILADFAVVHRGRYPPLEEADRCTIRWTGVVAYIAASVIAVSSPGIPPLNGIVAAFVLYGTGNLIENRCQSSVKCP